MASWKTISGLLLSAIGVGVSLSTFAFFYYGNYHAAVWALLSGLLAAVDFHLYVLHWRQTLNYWHSPSTVKDINILGVAGITFGVAFGIWYIFKFLYFNLPILPVPDSYQIAAVWAFMTAKWGVGILLTTRHLAFELEQNYHQILPSPSYHRNLDYVNRIRVL